MPWLEELRTDTLCCNSSLLTLREQSAMHACYQGKQKPMQIPQQQISKSKPGRLNEQCRPAV